MFLKFLFLTCLSIGVSLATTGPVNRATVQDPVTKVITITFDDFPEATLNPTCGSDGSLSLLITSESDEGSADIQVGPRDPEVPGCQLMGTVYPNGPGADQKVFSTTGDSCGRRVAADNGGFAWDVVVTQRYTSGPDATRGSEHPITVTCQFTVPTPAGVDVTAKTVAPDALAVADNVLPITFTLTPSATEVAGKWSFELTPENWGNLAGQNADFKIVDCTASAPGNEENPLPRLTAALITGSCIRDRGTKVNTDNSPTSQTITVSVFQFTSNPDAPVTMQCTIALCTKGGEDQTCPQVGAYKTCPDVPIVVRGTPKGRFQRSAAPQLYLVSTTW